NVEPMESLTKAYSLKLTAYSSWLWKIAVLLLPWQIRWFSATPIIGGYPWEQGRLSFYVSWVVMLFVIGVGIIYFCHSREGGNPSVDRMDPRVSAPLRTRMTRLMLFAIACLVFPSFFSVFLHATIQWWMEVLILVGFVWALTVIKVPVRSLATWFVISLIPHVLLAFHQYATQMVIGSTWLGMAGQNPLTSGVSVILHNGDRILRAYGGFPHPNIFGGWLAVALPFIVWLTVQAKRRAEKIAWMIAGAAFSIALVLTFSRSAWLAVFVGLLFTSIFCHSCGGRNPSDGSPGLAATRPRMTKQFLLSFTIIFLATSLTAFFEREYIFVRLDANQGLEQKSLNERQRSFQQGWSLFLQHPLIGVGPGATAYAMQSQIIPHFVPLLILDEVGLVGVIGLIILIFQIPLLTKERLGEVWAMVWYVAPLLLLSLLDHYPWSLWSGRALVAVVVAFFIINKLDKEHQRRLF
ncbi:MAG: O-antigen ligase family protein, partial [Candidatus Uhrbacteria bacterium]|nr:O-antigen ligase family protein [Candidatus Uhrbacteria bacterium]